MPLTRTWSAQTVDQVPADQTTLVLLHKSLMFAFKQFTTGATPAVAGGAWTVPLSSNGTTAGAGDNWGSSFDATKIKWHSSGNARSWIVLESPADFVQGGKVYLLFDLRGSGSDTDTHMIYHEMSSQPYTGGSTTALPTSPVTEAQLNGGSTIQWSTTSLGSGHQWSGTRNTLGDFAWFVHKDGQAFMQTGFLHISLTDHETVDDYASLGLVGWNDSAPGVPALAVLQQPASWVALWASGNSPASANQHHIMVPRNVSSGTDFLGIVDGGGSDISGDYYQWGMEVVCYAGTNIARRGRAADLALAPFGTGVTQGTGTPSGTFDKIILGMVWFPFSTKPTLT